MQLQKHFKHTKKLKLIGSLMLLSELLLLLFIFQWLRGQYKEEARQLSNEAQSIFTAVENSIADSILNAQVGQLVENQTNIDALSPQLVIPLHDSGGSSGGKSIHFYSDKPGTTSALPEQPSTAAIIIKPVGKKDSADAVNKVLGMALKEIANNINAGVFIKTETDTALLRKRFSDALAKRFTGVSLAWHWDKNVIGMFSYKVEEANESNKYLSLIGYENYLVKQIMPQVIFCFVLLLITSIAFILAYLNARRQNLFVQQKDDFISNITHELKTPVATAKIALEALNKYDAIDDPQRAKRYLKMADWELNRLETMMDKVMDITQITNGVLILNKERLLLPDLVQEIVSTFEPIFQEKKIKLEWDIPNPEIFVMADAAHLTGAVYNLIDNAVKYGHNTIKISIHKDKGEAYLYVADNGVGVPAAYRSKVFEKFVRIPQQNIHNVKGYGLGLSYARYVVEAHHGKLYLESKAGWGAVFSISLPEFSAADEV